METNPLCVPATLAVVINSMPALKDKLLVASLAVTRCRLIEVLQLKVSDVNTQFKTMRVFPGVGKIGLQNVREGSSVAVSLKNPVGELFLDLFKEYLRTQPEATLSADSHIFPRFTSSDSKRIRTEWHHSVTEALREGTTQSVGQRSTDGRARFTPHAFRRMIITAQARATLTNIPDEN
jgi:integrase